ncbi:hypothetical protein U5801_01940 [Lamprobacter modestohalophilus]|uniref:hypothetical protein n=1 Tax=Lamprobacter modestohalophilus TaxID=1064514 RepID=UPI002ADEF037|nr:hypothetical protein [Lamprobacter modestohalophilus]MEA1048585.1 hypothetical protein [Lamprobacter modestohalophilus]
MMEAIDHAPATPLHGTTEPSYERVTQAELARRFGVTRQAVNDWVKRGRITAYADGLIDPSRAAAELTKNRPINRIPKAFRPLQKELIQARRDVQRLQAERDALTVELARVRDQRRDLLYRHLECDRWLDDFSGRVAAICGDEQSDVLFEEAAGVVCGRPLAELAERIDPELRALCDEVLRETDTTPVQR